jgi:hypothetical protein
MTEAGLRGAESPRGNASLARIRGFNGESAFTQVPFEANALSPMLLRGERA